jgi:hypothetical protein
MRDKEMTRVTDRQTSQVFRRQLLLLAACLLVAFATLNPLRQQFTSQDRTTEIAALISADFLAPGRSHVAAPQAVHPGPDDILPGPATPSVQRPTHHHRFSILPVPTRTAHLQQTRQTGPRGPPPAPSI